MSITLRDFGSYTAGGRIHHVDNGKAQRIQVTRDASYVHDPKGHFAVEHAYVQYFIPEDRNGGPPVVLVHGGGMHGATWETTPDGRPGWLNLLLSRGYDVHVVDGVERGRAGWVPGLWQGEPLLRSMEEAWSLFRIGPPDGFADRKAFPGQQFPVEDLERFSRTFTPRWLSTSPLQVSALVAVLERIGPALVITHSQGGEIGFDAHSSRPDLVAGMIAVEPSSVAADFAALAACPLVLMTGDFLDADEGVSARSALWRRFIADCEDAGQPNHLLETRSAIAPGGSHMLMMDRHGAACLNAALETLPI